MNTLKFKIHIAFTALLFLFVISSCSKDEVVPAFKETGRLVKAEDIPEVTSALLSRMGLDKGNERFSVNNGVSNDVFNIDWDKILQLVDSTGKETYTFSIQDEDNNPFIFYNLVIRFNEYGNAFFPFIMKYEMSEEFIPIYLQTNSMKNFSGKISKIIISQPSSSNLENSANHSPDYVRSITGNPDCPQEEIDMSEGESTSGGGYLPPSGGSGGFTSYTVYEVCEYYIQDFYFISVTDTGVNSVVYDYSIIREECHTEIVYHNTTPDGGSECEIGDGDLPILPSDELERKIDDSELDECVQAVLNDIKNLTQGMSWIINRFNYNWNNQWLSAVTKGYNWKVKSGNLDNYTNATTSSKFDVNTNTVTTIFDSRKFAEASDLSMARTILHESLHAWLVSYFRVDRTSWGHKDYQLLIDDLSSGQFLTMNNTHHVELVRNWIDDISIALQEFGELRGYNLPLQYYEDLAWGGLTTYTNTNGEEVEAPWFIKTVPNSTTRTRISNSISIEQSGKDLNGNTKEKKGEDSGC